MAKSNYLQQRTKFSILILIFSVSLFSFSVLANNESRKLSIGISHGYYPYYYFNEKGLVGIFPDVINEIANRLNLDIEFKKYPWKRMLSNGKNGVIDAVMPVINTTLRSEYLNYTNEYIAVEENVLISLKGTTFNYDGDINDLHHLNVGIISGYSYGLEFDALDRSMFISSRDEKHLIKMLLAKRVKVIVGNIHVMSELLTKMKVKNNLIVHNPPISVTPLYIAFSKANDNSEEFTKEISSAIAKLKEDGTYSSILSKYGFTTQE